MIEACQEIGDCPAFIDNLPFTEAIEAAAPYRRINGSVYYTGPPDYLEDVWIQDEIEVGYTEAPYGRFHVALDSPRNRGLAPYARLELLGPNVGWFECPSAGAPHTTSSFGNLEVSPPVTVGGMTYPLGRIVFGTMSNTAISDFLLAQEVQAPFSVDTSFLYVKHVDEIFSFIPFGGGSQGFRVAVASPQRALEIMQQMITQGLGAYNLSLPPPPDPALWTLNDLLAPTAPSVVNESYNMSVEAAISSSRATLETALGLSTATDYLWIPVWFRNVATPPGSEAVAYSAGMVNGLYVSMNGFCPPIPYGPSSTGIVPFRFAENMDLEFQAAQLGLPIYIPDWHWYHLEAGEVHCGTNSVRTIPTSHWWTSP